MEKINMKSVGRAEEMISIAINDHNLQEESRVEYLYCLIDSLLDDTHERLNGSADDFHNFSVAIVKIANDYESALEIVQKGLEIHSSNTDLLADAIRYGYNCGKYDECEQWYESLESIPKKLWTWRAFSFTIDYMIDKLGTLSGREKECVDLNINYIIELAHDYKKYIPNEEGALISEYEIYSSTNQIDKGIAVLSEANEQLKYCPRCWLRYADVLVEQGDYEAAEPLIKKLRTNPACATDVNFSYVYYLDGLCNLSKILHKDQFIEEEVLKIYKSFKNALRHQSINANTKNKVLEQIRVLELESEMECPFDYYE